MLQGFLRAQILAERALAVAGVAILFAVMAIVTADVVMRYAVGQPIAWAYDIVSLYLMPGLFFLILPRSYAARAHIGVDIVQQRLPPAAQRVAQIVIGFVSALFFLELAKLGAGRAAEDYASDATVVGEFAWRTWLSAALVPLGCGLLVLRLALDTLSHAAPFFGGVDIVGLPAHPQQNAAQERR